MDTNLPTITISSSTPQKRKDTELVRSLKNYLMKWQQRQNSEKASQTAQIILSQVTIRKKWQDLLINNSFVITQVEKVLAADWDVVAKSINYPETIAAAIETPAPSLAVYRKYEDESATISVVSKMILWTLQMLNVQKSQDDFQVLMTAKMILSDYYFLTFAEIKYCFVRGIHGDFGQLYAKVDAMDLLKWLKEYCEVRSNFLEMQQERKSKKHKVELSKASYDPAMFEMVRDTLKRIEQKEKDRRREKQLSLLNARISFTKRRIEQISKSIAESEDLTADEKNILSHAVAAEKENLKRLYQEAANESQ